MESFRESICKSCANKRFCGLKILEERNSCMTGCSRYEEEKKQTNADWIRSMTDEELAEFLDDIIHDWGEGSAYIRSARVTVENWLDWLKEANE